MPMTRCLNGALTQIGRGVSTCEVAKLVDEGKLKPLIHEQRFTFDEINEAHAFFEAKRHTGKV